MRKPPTASYEAPFAPHGRIQSRQRSHNLLRWSSVWLTTLALSVSACAHTPHAMPAKEPPMNTPDVAAANSPSATSEAVGKRFLNLMDRLNAHGDISLGQIAEAMDVPVAKMQPRHNGYSAAVPIDENWLYALDMWQETAAGPWASIVLQFDHADDHEYADFGPVCGMTLRDYQDAFKARGFQEKLDVDQAGRLLAANYTANNFFVIVKPGLKDDQDGKRNPSCIRRIELMNRKSGG